MAPSVRITALYFCLAILVPTLAQAATLVFAASSLTDALTAVADSYEKTGQPRPILSFASSATLARQIENGAPAAIFVSADEQWMDYVAERKLIEPASRLAMLGNRLVLVAAKSEPLALEISPGFPLANALGKGKLAIADPDSVPAGRYAKAALEHLGAWRDVEANVVRAENVRAALAYVERGEAKAGVVYATDAAQSKNVRIVGPFPETSHPPIIYPLALVGQTPNDDARRFYIFMRSPAAADIYTSYGFTIK